MRIVILIKSYEIKNKTAKNLFIIFQTFSCISLINLNACIIQTLDGHDSALLV